MLHASVLPSLCAAFLLATAASANPSPAPNMLPDIRPMDVQIQHAQPPPPPPPQHPAPSGNNKDKEKKEEKKEEKKGEEKKKEENKGDGKKEEKKGDDKKDQKPTWNGPFFPPREAIIDPHTQKKDETPELKALQMPESIRKIYPTYVYRDTAPPNKVDYHQLFSKGNGTLDRPWMWWDPAKNLKAEKLDEAFFGVSAHCSTDPKKSPLLYDVKEALHMLLGKTACRRVVPWNNFGKRIMDYNNRHQCIEMATHGSATIEICGPTNNWVYCANVVGWVTPLLEECNQKGRSEGIIDIWAGAKTFQSGLTIRFRSKDQALAATSVVIPVVATKPEEPKKDGKKDEPKKEEPKKEEPKKEEPKKEEPKKEEPKKEEPKKEEPKKEEPKKDAPKDDAKKPEGKKFEIHIVPVGSTKPAANLTATIISSTTAPKSGPSTPSTAPPPEKSAPPAPTSTTTTKPAAPTQTPQDVAAPSPVARPSAPSSGNASAGAPYSRTEYILLSLSVPVVLAFFVL